MCSPPSLYHRLPQECTLVLQAAKMQCCPKPRVHSHCRFPLRPRSQLWQESPESLKPLRSCVHNCMCTRRGKHWAELEVSVMRMQVEPSLDLGVASCGCQLGSNLVFLGSCLANSLLIHVKHLQVCSCPTAESSSGLY